MGELDLIRWIRARIPRRRPGVEVDSGDDAAVVRLGKGKVLFKTDSVIDGVHFDGRTARPEEIGHKAIGRCLSDLAAMGGIPTFAVVAMMVPKTAREGWIQRVMVGMERTARAFDTAIVGGDLKSHKGKLAIAVAMLGRLEGPPVLRSGARPGDAIAVTGPLGGSILGKHLRFTPRVREALSLRRRFQLHAMIDLSDGLATDLAHLCEESGVGATIDAARVPIAPAARRLGGDPLQHALADGEDYELLFTVPAREAHRLPHVIGRVEKQGGLRLRRPDGRQEPIAVRGWEHRWA
ncbi:MAG TPA: thiamine-phosphate kinase [Planctomycetota bacterium]|nr:thiamine-phosphate kinase [Planctomycetota bacterium]